jgi:hypothetical protein
MPISGFSLHNGGFSGIVKVEREACDMERIKNLDRFQKCILLLLIAMLLLFTVIYIVASCRPGYVYMGELLLYSYEDGKTTYTGRVYGAPAKFTVTDDHVVTYTHGEKVYGPYTASVDPSAVPEEKDYMTGVEIRQGEEIFFRGGAYRTKDSLHVIGEDGSLDGFAIIASGGGTVTDANGQIIDVHQPSATTILTLMDGPELTSRGYWAAWFLALFVLVMTAVQVLFADELFRWNMSFKVRDVYDVEPSDWELMGRHLSWITLPILALVIYIMGLQV